MKAILIKPYNKGYVIDVNNEIDTYHELVDGYVEAIYRGPEKEYILLVNEEGQLRHLEENVFGFVGNVVIVRNGGEDFEELTDKDIEYFKGMGEIEWQETKIN